MPLSFHQKRDIARRQQKVKKLYDELIAKGETKTMAVLSIAKKLHLSTPTIYSDLSFHFTKICDSLIGKKLVNKHLPYNTPQFGVITQIKLSDNGHVCFITMKETTNQQLTHQFTKDEVEKLSKGEEINFYFVEEVQNVTSEEHTSVTAIGG